MPACWLLLLIFHTLFIASRAQGATSVVSWGYNRYGGCEVPANLGDVVSIAAGAEHSLALRADGTVVAWGSNLDGESDTSSAPAHPVSLAGGDGSSFALLPDGSVVGWGNTHWGAHDIPAEARDLIGLVCGVQSVVGVKRDGTVIAWGGSNWAAQNDVPAGLSDVVQVAAGYGFTMALKADGEVLTWGEKTPSPRRQATNVIAVAAGWDHALLLQADGKVVQWGPAPTVEANAMPADLDNVVAIAGGWFFSVALRRDGTVVQWPPPGDDQDHLPIPPELHGVTAISAHGRHCLALVGQPAALAEPRMSLRHGPGQTTLEIPTQRGRTYLLESTAALDSGVWKLKALRYGADQALTVSGSEPADAACQFFRVRVY